MIIKFFVNFSQETCVYYEVKFGRGYTSNKNKSSISKYTGNERLKTLESMKLACYKVAAEKGTIYILTDINTDRKWLKFAIKEVYYFDNFNIRLDKKINTVEDIQRYYLKLTSNSKKININMTGYSLNENIFVVLKEVKNQLGYDNFTIFKIIHSEVHEADSYKEAIEIIKKYVNLIY